MNFNDYYFKKFGRLPEGDIQASLVEKWVEEYKVKAGRKEKKAKIILSIRIPEEDKIALKESAEKRGVTLSRLCQKLLTKETLILLDKEVCCHG